LAAGSGVKHHAGAGAFVRLASLASKDKRCRAALGCPDECVRAYAALSTFL